MRTPIGVIGIDAVQAIEDNDITDTDVTRSGYDSLSALLADLRSEGTLYRIELHLIGADPRIELRARNIHDSSELQTVIDRLRALDARSNKGAWTEQYLRMIQERPGILARKLADTVGMEVIRFKRQVRMLKDLGLTESLEIGYRLSPRGESVLNQLTENVEYRSAKRGPR